MNDLLKLAAEIARGVYHPSSYFEDYDKGVGRRDLAAMAGEYADRLRGRVHVLTEAAELIVELEREVAELRTRLVEEHEGHHARVDADAWEAQCAEAEARMHEWKDRCYAARQMLAEARGERDTLQFAIEQRKKLQRDAGEELLRIHEQLRKIATGCGILDHILIGEVPEGDE
jgi:chromosome segregation ATPase